MTNLIDPNRVRFGPYEVDLHTRELWKFGTRMKLVGQPFEILAFMLSRPGELVTREDLRERLWPGETFVDFNHGLNAAINKLRDILSDSADDPKYIETLPRRGYRFIAKVEQAVAEEVAAPAIAAPAPQVAVEAFVTPPSEAATTHQRSPRWIWWSVAGVALLVMAFAVFVSFLKISGAWAERVKRSSGVAATTTLKGTQRTVAYGGKNEGPQFSPDSTRLVFMSDRTGSRDLWISDDSGATARQLTTMGDAGTPRWSPDGKKIAFDSHVHKYTAVWMIDASGGAPRLLVAGDFDNSVPNWSHDGKYLYFASNRTGQDEIWRLELETGKQEQITRGGGFAPQESSDGKFIYYAKNRFERPDVWRVPTGGGVETQISPEIRPGTWASWALADGKIYFVEEGAGDVAMLSAFDLQTQRMRQITLLGRFPFWLAINSNATKAAFDRLDSESATSLVELEDFE